MRGIIGILFLLLTIISCQENKNNTSNVKQTDWENRKSEIEDFGHLTQGKTYLPVYSHIYHRYEDREYLLTVTVSLRNISPSDSVHILKADYYNTEGDRIRHYLEDPIYLKPLETLEIIIEEDDTEGGSGANFIFDWAVNNEKNPPLFEAVMISTHGTQGLSFTTQGVQIFR